MADPILSVGTTFAVSAAKPATNDIAGFEALTWTVVGDVESLGTFGGSTQIQNFTPLNTGVIQKLKGSTDYGQIDCQMADNPADAGQILLKAAFDGTAQYTVHSFRVINSDTDTKYFMGLVSSYEYDTGDANTVRKVSAKVEVNSKVVRDVPA